MANVALEEDFSDGNERSTESSDDAESDDSTYDVKKSNKGSISSRSKYISKRAKKKLQFKSNLAKKRKRRMLKIKEEPSDDSYSQMSDVNPPSIATRSRKYKRTASTTSSNASSGVRKAKSEPLLITLDSDSDCVQQSPRSNRKNRSARIQGEMIRKYGSMTDRNKSGYSSSSSESNINFKTVSTKVLFANRLKKKQHHLGVKRGSRLYIMQQAPLNKKRRLKIQNIHKRVTEKGFGRFSAHKHSSKPASLKSVKMEKKSSAGHKSLREPTETEQEDPDYTEQPPPPKRPLGRPRKKKMHWRQRKKYESIEEDIRRIAGTTKTAVVKKERTVSDGEDSDGRQDDEDDEILSLMSKEEIKEAYKTIDSDIEKIRNSRLDVDDGDVSEDSEGEKNSKVAVNSQPKKSHKKKIGNKPPVNVVRRRGRPRLSESLKKAAVVSDTTPVDALSFFNIKAKVPFLQNSFCFDVAPKLSKCRECRIAVYRNSRRMYNSYCRFMEYRKLEYTKQGEITGSGFSSPSDATREHMKQWLPNPKDPPKDLDSATAKALLQHCGDQFCDLITQEQNATELDVGMAQTITWKRIVQGVREMCDVCSTTIFNMHWVCPVCGFAVCIDCYKVRLQGIVPECDEEDRAPTVRDEFKWLLCCSTKLPHSQDCLIMAQMIPGNALEKMGELLHKVRNELKIPSFCKCYPENIASSNKKPSTGIVKQLVCSVNRSFSTERNNCFSQLEKNKKSSYDDFLIKKEASYDDFSMKKKLSYDDLDVEVNVSALKWLKSASINSDNIHNNYKSDDDLFFYEDCCALGNHFIEDNQENQVKIINEDVYNVVNAYEAYAIEDIIEKQMILSVNIMDSNMKNNFMKTNYNTMYPQPISALDPLPIRIFTKTESILAFPNVPHSWFCNGRLLFLHEANHEGNLALFQEQWKRGQPIVVQGVDKRLNMDLWRPEGFCKDFGEVKNDLVNCKTGTILRNMPMRKFWEGFENFGKRLTDDNGEYMILKLKDWPPGEDFSEKLPTRFNDLMKSLPLPEYTHRNGILNLAGRLPSSFVRPDLGPKMYNAYGSALVPQKGTTNLHLDMSDAVNVMVYVGIPTDGESDEHIQYALNAIYQGDCDSMMQVRVRSRLAKPGALWHIYSYK